MRSKARHDRWDEEVRILRAEMDWTRLSFDGQQKTWNERALKVEWDGHKAYAFRQAAMWDKFGKEARRVLGKYMI